MKCKILGHILTCGWEIVVSVTCNLLVNTKSKIARIRSLNPLSMFCIAMCHSIYSSIVWWMILVYLMSTQCNKIGITMNVDYIRSNKQAFPFRDFHDCDFFSYISFTTILRFNLFHRILQFKQLTQNKRLPVAGC